MNCIDYVLRLEEMKHAYAYQNTDNDLFLFIAVYCLFINYCRNVSAVIAKSSLQKKLRFFHMIMIAPSKHAIEFVHCHHLYIIISGFIDLYFLWVCGFDVNQLNIQI